MARRSCATASRRRTRWPPSRRCGGGPAPAGPQRRRARPRAGASGRNAPVRAGGATAGSKLFCRSVRLQGPIPVVEEGEMATVAPTLPRLGVPAVLAGAQSDAALARIVGLGDQRAFELLYQRYRDQLHRYCASQLRQREDAEEALQATMLNAY